jgi:GNAT superfamily N-acetyltransferase
MPLNLDHHAYMFAEGEGYARFYLVYVEDKPVAYMSVMAHTMMQHKDEVAATTDAFYVAPDYRKGGVFGKLLEFVEQDLKACGIRFFTVGTNPMYKGKTEQFLDHVGYCKTEVHYTKELI